MKHIKKFNESKVGDFVRRTFNKDEETAIGIYDKIQNESEVEDGGIKLGTHTKRGQIDYITELDDFVITSRYEYDIMSDFSEFCLIIDDVTLKCSNRIAEKIYKKLSSIYNKKIETETEFVRKDAKINFRRNKN